jgi:GTP-binding protein
MIEKYLSTSKNLKNVIVLVDIRHDPTALDVMMYNTAVNAGFEPIVVATKLDKIKKSQLQKQLGLLRRTLRQESHVPAKQPGEQIRIIPWSGQTKSGREEIYAVLDELLAGPEAEENANDLI